MAEEIVQAIQIIKVAYEGIEIAVRIGSGGLSAAKEAINSLIGLLEYEKTMGKTKMKKLLMKGGDLQVFQFPTKETKTVKKLLKKYGVLYSELPDINKKDGMSEIIFHAEAVPRINMILRKLTQGKIGSFDEYVQGGDSKNYDKLMRFLKGQKQGNAFVHDDETRGAEETLEDLIQKVGLFATEKEEISVEEVKDKFSLKEQEAADILVRLESMGLLMAKEKGKEGSYGVQMDKEAFQNKFLGYLELCERAKAAEATQKSALLDITISDKMIVEMSKEVIKTRVPGTFGEETRYLITDTKDVLEVHGGKTLLTFLDPEEEYTLYDEKGAAVEVKKGKELYEKHYDKVEASVRERYQKIKEKPSRERKPIPEKGGDRRCDNPRKN